MNRSVDTHHWTAWCRSHRATSRWTAGKARRRRSGRGGKRIAGATTLALTASLPQFQPDQKAVGQHDRHRMPMKAGPEAPLILIPPQLPLGFLVELLDRIPPMRIAGQF